MVNLDDSTRGTSSELLKLWSNTVKKHLRELGEHEDSVNLIREGALPRTLEHDFPQAFTLLPIDESASPEERARIEAHNALSAKLQHEVDVTRKISQAHFRERQQYTMANEQEVLAAERILDSISPEDFYDVWNSLKGSIPRGVSYRIDSMLRKLEQEALQQEEIAEEAAPNILDQFDAPPAENPEQENLQWSTFLHELQFQNALKDVLKLMKEKGINLNPEDVTYDVEELIIKALEDTQFDGEVPENISKEGLIEFRVRKFHDQKMYEVHKFYAEVMADGKDAKALAAVETLRNAETLRLESVCKNAMHRHSQDPTRLVMRTSPKVKADNLDIAKRSPLAPPTQSNQTVMSTVVDTISVMSGIHKPSDDDPIFNEDKVLHGGEPVVDVQKEPAGVVQEVALEDSVKVTNSHQ